MPRSIDTMKILENYHIQNTRLNIQASFDTAIEERNELKPYIRLSRVFFY